MSDLDQNTYLCDQYAVSLCIIITRTAKGIRIVKTIYRPLFFNERTEKAQIRPGMFPVQI